MPYQDCGIYEWKSTTYTISRGFVKIYDGVRAVELRSPDTPYHLTSSSRTTGNEFPIELYPTSLRIHSTRPNEVIDCQLDSLFRCDTLPYYGYQLLVFHPECEGNLR